jgi:hypothetical protein
VNIARTSLQGVTYHNRTKTYGGYTLFAPVCGPGDVWLIDMEGRFVHHWRMPYSPGAHGIFLPSGNLLYLCRIVGGPLDDFGSSAAKLIEVDWDGNIVWEYDDVYLSHDFYRMKNGNTMVIRWVAMPEETTKKVKGGLPGTEREGIMWGDVLRELNPDGKIVWEWTAYEHMDPDIDILCPLCARTRWANANSVFVMDNGDILLSQRFTNMLLIVDKKTGDIKWRWGPGEIAHPHHPQVLENGNILVFDNGFHRNCIHDFEYSRSRVVEVNPETKEIVWEYEDETPINFYSCACGGCQRLPNGNTLICEALMGRIFEVTPYSETVWEYVVPFYYKHPFIGTTNFIFRAYRYGPDFEGLKGKDLAEVTKVPAISQRAKMESRVKALGY